MQSSGIIYYYEWDSPSLSPGVSPSQQPFASHALEGLPPPVAVSLKSPTAHGNSWTKLLGVGMIALAIGGLSAPLLPRVRLESHFYLTQLRTQGQALRGYLGRAAGEVQPPQPAIPALFDPLKQPDGSVIEPVDKKFSLIIPNIGVNAAVIPSVNPTKPGEYIEALKKGIAHSSLSYFPDEDGTTYLFSHSTNYDWFVSDLNAIFYLLKNLEEGDLAVIYYKGAPYTYKITGKQVVKPSEIEYLVPQAGARRLILQTCWPPGSVAERLLIFADLVEDPTYVL